MSGGRLYALGRDRHLVIAAPDAVRDVLTSQTRQRPVVALLTSHSEWSSPLEPVIQVLLDHGCDYFVCVGAGSEALHDWIDDHVVNRTPAVPDSNLNVVTTWHDDEPLDEVAHFLVNVAAARDQSLVVAVLDEDETELARVLVQQTLS